MRKNLPESSKCEFRLSAILQDKIGRFDSEWETLECGCILDSSQMRQLRFKILLPDLYPSSSANCPFCDSDLQGSLVTLKGEQYGINWVGSEE